MTTIEKIVFGIGAAIGAVTVYAAVKTYEKKYTTVNEDGKEKSEVEDKSLKERIKEFAVKKTEQILGFAAKHYEEIKNATAIIGLAAGAFELMYRIKKLSEHDKILKEINTVEGMICESASMTAAIYVGDDTFKESAKHYIEVFKNAKENSLF